MKYRSFNENCKRMIMERTGKEGLQQLADYFTYKEATKSKAKQRAVDALAKEIKKGWWTKNKSRLMK